MALVRNHFFEATGRSSSARCPIRICLLWRTAIGLLFSLTILAQGADEERRARDSAEQLAKIQKNFGPVMNSPGATISLREKSRRKEENGTAVRYRLFASGLPKDQVYTVLSVPLNSQPTEDLQGVTLDDSGQAICAGKPDTCGDAKKPNDPIDFVMFAAKGEPKRIALVSQDGQSKAFAYVVPFPIIGSNRGCSLEALLLLPNAEAVLLHGSGFDPNSSIHYTGNSAGEEQAADATTGDDGSYYSAQLPYVKGKSEGTMRVTLRSPKCSPSISYAWGKNSYHFE